MKSYKFIGTFKSFKGKEYTLEVKADSFFQAFFLLTADAIRSGKHYQLERITDEKGEYALVDDIMKVSRLLTV